MSPSRNGCLHLGQGPKVRGRSGFDIPSPFSAALPGAQSSWPAECGGLGMSFNICRGTIGSLAMLIATKECLAFGEQLRGRPAPRLLLEIDVCERVAICVLHDKARIVVLIDRPGRRESAGRGHWLSCPLSG